MTRNRSRPGSGRRLLRVAVIALALCLFALVGLALAWREPDRSVAQLAPRWALPPSQFVAVGGMQVHLRDEGPRDDPIPVVLLHGTAASLHTWDGWTAALSSRHRVTRFDLPGFGLTGPTPDGVYGIDRYVATVVGVMDALGVPRFVLGGNSLGGYVAWATALWHPERVAALVLVDAAGYRYESHSVPLAFTLARTPVVGQLFEQALPRSLIESSLRNVYGDPSKVTPELVDRYFELATRAGNRQALLARFEQTQPGALAERVPEIGVPTLILWGAGDRLIPPQFGERFAREIRGSRLLVFPGLGHVPQEEDPAVTVVPMLEFLAGLRPATVEATAGQGPSHP